MSALEAALVCLVNPPRDSWLARRPAVAAAICVAAFGSVVLMSAVFGGEW